MASIGDTQAWRPWETLAASVSKTFRAASEFSMNFFLFTGTSSQEETLQLDLIQAKLLKNMSVVHCSGGTLPKQGQSAFFPKNLEWNGSCSNSVFGNSLPATFSCLVDK